MFLIRSAFSLLLFVVVLYVLVVVVLPMLIPASQPFVDELLHRLAAEWQHLWQQLTT